jgi:hypothetical protein
MNPKPCHLITHSTYSPAELVLLVGAVVKAVFGLSAGNRIGTTIVTHDKTETACLLCARCDLCKWGNEADGVTPNPQSTGPSITCPVQVLPKTDIILPTDVTLPSGEVLSAGTNLGRAGMVPVSVSTITPPLSTEETPN